MVILTELLPGSSSSSPPNHDHNYRYEVFLSFRGVDTRNSFTDHLYNALRDADITTFLDDEEIETGEPLKPELESAIKSSRVSIIVLSENYASSTWCLDELVLILEQKRNFNQIVIPIFYHVEPTHVRKQHNSFGQAMAKHTQRMEDEKNAEKRTKLAQKIELRKKALTDVANLKGKDLKGRKETEFIKEVVTEVRTRLGPPLSNASLPLLVGMDYYVESVSSWLTDGSSHAVDILTVVGMGGIGKTSLAKYVFQLHADRFYKTSFIEGIDRRCNERFEGLLDLQKQLHGDISKKTPLQVNDVSVYTSKIEKALIREKVFIVLDDIGSIDQLDALLGNKGVYPGSKIIITTKDASLTERCALFKSQLHPSHLKVRLNGLFSYESLELLCIHAFESHTPEEGYEEVSEKLVKYCEGHPLAIKLLGKVLYNRHVAYWEECLKGLKREPHSSIKEVFQMSINSLPSNEMELFKHIACFFVGKDRDFTETILNACDLETRYGIMNLIDKCLLSIDNKNYLTMHSLIQDMGRDLVRQESVTRPERRSRLWCHEESFKVLKHKKGTEDILGLALDMRMVDKKKLRGSFELKTKSFTHMNNLMLLQLSYVELNGSFDDFPEELRWLCMHGSPLKSIPLDLPMEYLVALDMSDSNIESFDMSKHKRLLESLKILNLSFCQHLQSVGGFMELPALERLIVRECIRLIEVCESVEHCVELIHIDLSYCYMLKKIPISISKLKKVKTLLLDGISSHESEIGTMPRDLKLTAVVLPSSLRVLSLADNNLFNESFPKDFSSLSMLEELCLDRNPIVSMPDCVRSLPRLEKLYMDHCHMIISVERPPNMLRELSVKTDSLRKIKFDPEMSTLNLYINWDQFSDSTEIDGAVKVQAMAGVEEKVLNSLGWRNLDFTKEKILRVGRYSEEPIECQSQMMWYEFGIFSTLYWGNEMPDWIEYRSEGPWIFFTIPSSPNKLRGLNLCFILKTCEFPADEYVKIPWIRIHNITKKQTWFYSHYIKKVKLEGECLSLLSHWMFGPNEMKGGDQINIEILRDSDACPHTRECGISLVYEEDGKIEEEEEEEDVLSYYKSWNHIIGGDLSDHLIRTGLYFMYTASQKNFKAFSQKKSEIADQGMNTETKQDSKGKAVLSDPVNSKGGLGFKRKNLEVGSSSENTEKRQKMVESPCASDATVNSSGCNDKC